MTGTDRLRTLAGEWDAWGLGGALGDVARQIERERACDADTIENIRLIVGGVVDEMERHVSGIEGAEDSPVTRWARELRYALKSDASDARRRTKAQYFSHERPDSWEKWREDEKLRPIDYCAMIGYPPSEEESAELIKNRDLVRRAKALAGEA